MKEQTISHVLGYFSSFHACYVYDENGSFISNEFEKAGRRAVILGHFRTLGGDIFLKPKGGGVFGTQHVWV